MKAIGIDIGTTTISVVLVDNESGNVIESNTVPNTTGIRCDEQEPDIMYEIVKDIIDKILKENDDVSCIGIAGQMHGIVYVSKEGKSISPLYTWRHDSGNEMYKDTTYAEYLSLKTNYRISSGYGFSTLFYHKENSLLPEDASFCSIGDYIALRLTKSNSISIHTSIAHSFGLFDLEKLEFDKEAIKSVGIDISLPKVVKDSAIVGYYGDIPVSVAIGDNQASFLGSVNDMENTILFNMGTGSQISYMSKSKKSDFNMELRPLVNDMYLQVGCSLCGGSALLVLQNFFSEISNHFCKTDTSEYSYINYLIDKIIKSEEEYTLKVSTLFKGTRLNPSLRGNITNIDFHNFTPENLLNGFVHGMVNELYELYEGTNQSFSKLVGAGNGFVKNLLMQKVVKETFGMDAFIPVNKEQSAYGAALFAMYSIGVYSTIEEVQKLIKYMR